MNIINMEYIMRYKFIFIILLSICIFNCNSDMVTSEIIINSPIQQKIINKYCDNFIISKKFNYYEIKLSKTNFLKLLHNLNLLILFTMDNLDNYNNAKTANGEPYKKKILIINEDLDIEIKEETNDTIIYKYIYDPNHPDSIKKGKMKGYIIYPNINTDLELELLIEYITLYKILVKAIIKKYPKIGYNVEIFDYYIKKYANKEYSY